jgi:hypothetical protein
MPMLCALSPLIWSHRSFRDGRPRRSWGADNRAISRQLSDDKRFWWDGTTWQPVNLPTQAPSPQQVVISNVSAFRFGFFAFFGALLASVSLWVLVLIGIAALAVCGNSLRGDGRFRC